MEGAEPVSAADRLEDGFPHGTREGYDQGCRGSHCPAVDDGFLSCAQARTRYQSDYAYRKRTDAGLSPAQLAEVDEREAAEQRARLAAARANRVASAPEPEPDAPVDEPVEAPAIADERHGTTSGYSAGCRLKERCPGVALVGKSCTQAATEYQRDVKRRRREALDQARAATQVRGKTPDLLADRSEPRSFLPLRAEDQPDAGAPSEPPYVVALRGDLALEKKRADEAEELVIQWADKFEDRQKRVAELTDRVAALELELDVAKAATPMKVVGSSLEVEQVGPMRLIPSAPVPSRFRFARDTDGGVVVDVEGQQPGFVRFEVDEAGTLTGVAVQSGK